MCLQHTIHMQINVSILHTWCIMTLYNYCVMRVNSQQYILFVVTSLCVSHVDIGRLDAY